MGKSKSSQKCVIDESTVDEATVAHPIKFKTTVLSGSNSTGKITHRVKWESSSGDLADLSDVLTREYIVFDGPLLDFMPAYHELIGGQFQLQGDRILTKVGGFGNSGGGEDVHSPGRGAFFDPKFGFGRVKSGSVSTLVGNQVYQFRDPVEGWLNIPGASFTITRNIAEIKGTFYLTAEKKGQGMRATARIKMYDNMEDFISSKGK